MRARLAALAVAAGIAAAVPASAECAFPGQRPLLSVQLFFGGGVPAAPWARFLADTVTPQLPDGFTAWDAYGQWADPRTRRLSRERTRVLLVAGADTPEFRARVAAVAERYKARFRQHSVGLLSHEACGAF